MKVFVGNLSFDLTEEDLSLASEEFGKVESVSIIKDKSTGRSKGFGFIEMSSTEEANELINGLNGKEIKGRAINASEARPQKNNFGNNRGGFDGNRGSFGGNRGGFGGNKGGYNRGGFSGNRGGQGISRGGNRGA